MKNHSEVNKKLKYRPDIDGLRAIAVLAVLMYHADVPGISGGFVGVDIFFVISGYLITKILINEISSTGTIDFYSFYLRRLRRIFPALLFTLALTTVAAVLFSSSYRLESYGASLFHALISISNIFFYYESGYFDIDSKQKPLLHTWSLGVEEQFYLIWPIILLFFGLTVARRSITISLMGILGLILAMGVIRNHPAAVFFLMPFRIFEFMLGGVLVVLERREIKSARLNDGIFLLGLVLMALAVVLYTKETRFPGAAALLPCLGAAFCIYAGERAGSKWLLSNRAFVWVGLISYSLYLVHWPIIVFYRQVRDVYRMGLADSLLVIAASIVLSVFVYFFIESKFRKGAVGSDRGFLVGIGSVSLVLLYIGASMWANDGWKSRPWRTEYLSAKAIEDGKSERFKVRRLQCEQKGWNKCDDVIPGRVNALIVGDSHAPDALNGLYRIFPAHNYAMSTLGGCPPYLEIEKLVPPSHPDLNACKAINAKRYDIDYLKQFDYITVSVLFGWYSYDSLMEYLNFLKASGIHKVVVVGGYLNAKNDFPELINKYGYSREKLWEFVVPDKPEDELGAAVGRLGYLFVSKMDAFCSTGLCELYTGDGIPFTYDNNHLSAEFASKIFSSSGLAEYLEIGG